MLRKKYLRLPVTAFLIATSPLPLAGAGEQAQAFTVKGQLLDATSTPILDGNVTIKLDIFDPTAVCLLYEETQTGINTENTNGMFALQVGSAAGATKRTGGDPGLNMAQIFRNDGTAIRAAGSTNCSPGYMPTTGDARLLRVTVTPSSTGVAITLTPDATIGSVPTALAAETLQGLLPSSFIQTNGSNAVIPSGSGLSVNGAQVISPAGQWVGPAVAVTGANASTFSAGTLASPGIEVSGTNSGIYQPAANDLAFSTGGVEALQLNYASSAVNYCAITPSISGQGPTIGSAGSDPNVPLNLFTQGSSGIVMKNANGTQFQVVDGGPGTQNFLTIQGGTSAVPPAIGATGAMTNISIDLIPKGTGGVGIGTTSPAVSLDLSGRTDAVSLPIGSTAQRPASAIPGDIRYNVQTGVLESYITSGWQTLMSSAGTAPFTTGVTMSGPGSGLTVVNNEIIGGSLAVTGAMIGAIHYGSSLAGGGLILQSTANATQGVVAIAPSGGNVGVGTLAPAATLDVFSSTTGSMVTSGAFRSTPGTGGINTVYLDNKTTGGTLANRLTFASNGTMKWAIGNDQTVNGSDNFYFYDGSASAYRLVIDASGNLVPGTSASQSLGTSSLLWSSVYATNGTIQTSDRRLKRNIAASALGLDFINQLEPVSYQWKAGGDDTVHYGFIAQDLQAALQKTVPDQSPAMINHDPKTDRYGVIYSELIAPTVRAIQELAHGKDDHEARLRKLEAENAALKKALCELNARAQFCAN